MYTLEVKTHIDSAHYLPNYDGKCSKMHGHRWEIVVSLQSMTLDDAGMVIDFARVKDCLKNICPDHAILNNYVNNPTAENLAHSLYEQLSYSFDNERLKVVSVTVNETPECGATFYAIT